ncbi:response regulator transcription factor [bacterium]|nr:response regulator transcription factor [bacterium]
MSTGRMSAGRRVLLIEDDLSLGELLVICLTKNSNVAVSWFVRARLSANSQDLILMEADGREVVFTMKALASDFDLAFVDYRLKMSIMSGIEVTRKLASAKLKVIASSGLFTLNEELIAAGATAAIDKDKIIGRALKEPDFIEKLC